jgi:hypothetical protein
LACAAAELPSEKLTDLRPDVVHLSTLFEGFVEDLVTSVGQLDSTLPTAVTLLIPLLHPQTYLTRSAANRAYLRRAESLKRADLLLAISESSRQEAIAALEIDP